MAVHVFRNVRAVRFVMKQRAFVRQVVRLSRSVVAIHVFRNAIMLTALIVKTVRVVKVVVKDISAVVLTVFPRIAVNTEKNIHGMKTNAGVRLCAVQRNMIL